MPGNPFVSIIIPVKNFERTIEKSFEYLLNVDYPHDSWEWIIADGGSSDKTIPIIKEWQKKYPFIKMPKTFIWLLEKTLMIKWL